MFLFRLYSGRYVDRFVRRSCWVWLAHHQILSYLLPVAESGEERNREPPLAESLTLTSNTTSPVLVLIGKILILETTSRCDLLILISGSEANDGGDPDCLRRADGGGNRRRRLQQLSS